MVLIVLVTLVKRIAPSSGTHPATNVVCQSDNVNLVRGSFLNFLARERVVISWGTEGVGTDAGQAYSFAEPFPCRSDMRGNNKFGLASLVNLDKLPATGALLITLPPKIRRGSSSLCRVLARLEGSTAVPQ